MERVFVKIHGIVQGVGFRPFIHRLVREHGLTGYIKNTSSGVELELDGEQSALTGFLAELPHRAPKLAVIESIESETIPINGKPYDSFEIRSSKTEEFRNTLISPDICICDDCLRELRTPSDRRYRYPFINCTNCGPRFTIIKDVPYDRAKTSMNDFPMCPDCDREYHDIENRRYHAQPDACFVCGPEVFFTEGGPASMTLKGESAIETARNFLKEGKIVAIKGLGGMHLACRPDRAPELRKRKQRDEKPFAIMCRDADCARSICELSPEEEKILCGFRRPIVLLKKKRRDAVTEAVSENGFVGVMIPYTPIHYLLFGDDIDMLIMTSANLSDTPIMYRNEEALQELAGIADGFLLNNRDIQTRCDDSLCWVLNGKEYFARRSRGYVPFPIRMTEATESILACGAEQKASFCLTKGNYAFLSQHIGDLKNFETYEHYEQQIRHFERMFDIAPKAVACDLHPDYLSTQYAQDTGLPFIQVQHHHAHLASCMADNGLDGEVIGLIWDGTGLGPDGTIWGGECLIGGYRDFRRVGSIRPIPLIGGDRATKELTRVSAALLQESGVDALTEEEKSFAELLALGINCPLSSGMGRLFDGVAAILGIKRYASYEGQGAVLLEAAAGDSSDFYDFDLTDGVFDWRPMIRQLAEEKNPAVGSAKFMNTLIEMAVRQVQMASEQSGLDRVVLSGGSFQNMVLMKRLPARLESVGFRVYQHSRVSCNDEGISLGQVMICASQYR